MFVKYVWYRTSALTATAVGLVAMACSEQGTEPDSNVAEAANLLSPSDDIRDRYSASRAFDFLKELVDLGPRIAAGPQENAAAELVAGRFVGLGLSTTVETYPVPTLWKDKCGSQLTITEPALGPLAMSAMGYSPPADVTGRVIFVGLGYPEDYAKYAAGQQGYLALIMRGVIPFAFKAQYAFEAGAAGAIVINNRHVEGAFPALSAGTSSVAIGNITLEDGIGILQRLYPEGIPELGDDLTSNVTVRARLKVDTERNVAPSPQVIGTLKGTHPNLGTLYMTSGLDSYGIAGRANPDGSVICPYSYVSGALEGSPGANDNASGVAVMVEAARVLTTGHRMKASIKFVAFGGGETGASGSVAYALAHREELMTAALGDINLDMLGVGKYLLLGNLSSPPTLARFGLAKAQAMGIDVIDATGWMPQSSNQAAFEWSGVPALQFLRFIGEEPHPVNFVDDPNFHLPTDTADKIDPQLLEIAGELASAIAYDYAKNPERRERKAALESGECEPPCNGK